MKKQENITHNERGNTSKQTEVNKALDDEITRHIN